MKRFVIRRIVKVMLSTGLFACASHATASGFQLWEQDGASIGNYHAGYAAEANDASTAWYNPAGITRFTNQQLVFGVSAIDTNFQYKGNVSLTELSPVFPADLVPTTVTMNGVKANGGVVSFVPSIEYVAPISDKIGFGFSVVVPFGLETDYGRDTPLRYAATRTGISVIDISPSLGIKVSDKTSVGLGFDIQSAKAEFNSVAGLITPSPIGEKTILTSEDSRAKNRASDTGYGYHLGALYEFTPDTRVGISYHSKVAHHFTGKSTFDGPINVIANDDEPIISRHTKADAILPSYTALSLYHKANPNWAVMASVIYTEWNVFKRLRLQNVAGVINDPDTIIASSSTITILIPEKYRNTWNASLGVDYFPCETVTLRTGLGYDQSPARNSYRNVQLPDSDRYVVAVGGHYQASKTIGLDLGYMHVFTGDTHINPPPQVMGAETVGTNGKVSGGANVVSGQITWDIL